MQVDSLYNSYSQENILMSKKKNDNFTSEVQNIQNIDELLNKAQKELPSEEYVDLVGFVWKSELILSFQNSAKLDLAKAHSELVNVNTNSQKAMLNEMIDILKSPHYIQKGLFMGQPETAEHFNARKNQAIDYLSELLAQI